MNSGLIIRLKRRCREFVFASSFFISVLLSVPMSAKFTNSTLSDSLKKKYPLSDPRNPNCPCHKYQKKAEKEFHKLNKHKQKSVSASNHLSHPKGGVTSHFPYFYSQRTHSLYRRGFLKKTSLPKREKRKMRSKFSLKKSPDSCPKWQFRR